MDVSEGAVTVTVPELSPDGAGEAVFYNPRQERNRDVTIAALRALRSRNPDLDTYLDATAASGIRGVRAAADGWTVACCDRDPDATALCERNLEANDLSGSVHTTDANVHLHAERYDVVDVDPFGSPVPFLDAAFRSAHSILCLTATDTAPLCGAHFDAGRRRYGVIARPTTYHAELGLRTLLSAACRTAAKYDVAITPLLSHVESHSVRTYLALDRGAGVADDTLDELGYLIHCPECLYRESSSAVFPDPPAACPNCDGEQLLTMGPIWLGHPHDSDLATAAADAVDPTFGTAENSRTLLETIAGELDQPTHYNHHKLCKRWGRSAGGMDAVIEGLRDAGFDASRTHYGGTTFKTTANVSQIRAATG